MKPTFIMMVGLPGSGKSTKAHELSCLYNCPVFSSDSIREELTGSEECLDRDNEVFQILHTRVKEYLINHQGENKFVVYDACNIGYKKRMAFLQELKKIDCRKVCYFVWTPYTMCLENNKNRNRVVPEYAIKRMYKNIYIPQYYEGWDYIIIDDKRAKIKNRTITDLFYDEYYGLCNIDQENPHHTLSIGDHCIACYMNTLSTTMDQPDFNLSIAALLHDIGKAFTKDFFDSKGEPCDHAHYYQHHLVSAYDAVEFLEGMSNHDKLEILALIQWHMFPYFWEKDNNTKMQLKYRRLWGEKLHNKIMALHKADKEAH